MRRLVFVERSPSPNAKNQSTSVRPADLSLKIEAPCEPYSPTISLKKSHKDFKRGLALADKLYGFSPTRPRKQHSISEAPKPAAEPTVPEKLRRMLRRNTIRKPSISHLQSIGTVLQELLFKTRRSTMQRDSDDGVGRNLKVLELLSYHSDRMKKHASSPRRIREQPMETYKRNLTPVGYKTNQVRSKSTGRSEAGFQKLPKLTHFNEDSGRHESPFHHQEIMRPSPPKRSSKSPLRVTFQV